MTYNFPLCFYTYMLLAGWEVRIGKNCDRGLENTSRGRRPRAAFSSPRSQFFPIRTDPKPDNNIFIFFSCGKLAYKWVCLHNFVIELASRAFFKPFAKKKKQRANERVFTRQTWERCIKEQIYFELLSVSCISFTSVKCLFWYEQKICYCYKLFLSVAANQSKSDFCIVKWVANSEETRQVYSTEISSNIGTTREGNSTATDSFFA